MFQDVSILNTNKGTDVKLHAVTENSEEENKKEKKVRMGWQMPMTLGVQIFAQNTDTFLHVAVLPILWPDFIKTIHIMFKHCGSCFSLGE